MRLVVTEAEQRVLNAAREWMVDRKPIGPAEKELFVALCRTYPEDIHTRETCECEERETCDECLSADAAESAIEQMESELGLR
jgi:hypothetical protein